MVDPEGCYLHNTLSELNEPLVYDSNYRGCDNLSDDELLSVCRG
jgi:hypothetical protein